MLRCLSSDDAFGSCHEHSHFPLNEMTRRDEVRDLAACRNTLGVPKSEGCGCHQMISGSWCAASMAAPRCLAVWKVPRSRW
ncbi:hypothetical protein JOF41_000886 [Saccharothrix coeruleofusca]|nr:hypothetical protein [Saccharothrix coeruleofusca]